MANSRKKISELPALNVATLDTTFVLGISGSTTYKISINNLTSSLDGAFATDLVTNALSSSLNSKLSTSSFNSYTASFTSSVASGTISGSSQLTSSFDTRYIVSGSVTQTTWDNISGKPAGIVSQSTDLSSLNTFTASISTASLVNRLNTIESVSGSWITESETGSFLTSLSGAISSSTQISDLGFVTGSYTTINSFNSLTQSFNSISQSFTTISSSVGGVDFNGVISSSAQITTLGFVSGSYLTSLSGAISSSSQLTSSYDTRYTLSGSVQPLPSNLLSSSAQITAFGFISSSQTIDSGSLLTTSSFNSYTASISTASLVTSITNLNTTTASLNTSVNALNTATSSYETKGRSIVSGSSQLTSSYDGRYIQTGSFNTYTSSFSSSLATSITSVSGSFTNLTVNGQPTTYGVINPAYLVTGLVSSVYTLGLNQTIILDTTLGNVNSQVSYNNSTGIYTLVAGVTYEMSFTPSFIGFSNTTGGFLIYEWVDATTNTPLDSTSIGVGTAVPFTDTGAQNDNVTAKVIYTPSTNQTIKLYVTSANGTATLRGAIGTQATIKPLNLSVAIQATATGTMNATVGKVTLSNSYSQVVGASSPGTTIFTLPTLQPGTYLITAQAKVNGGYSAMGIFTGGSQVANTSVFNWYQASGTVNNGLQGTWVLTVTTPTVYTINAWGGGTVSAGSDGTAVANYIQINPTFALNTLNTMQISGSLTTTGSITSLGGITGSIAATNGVISSSSQLTTAFPSKTTGAWSVPAGASTQSFTVESGHSYSMWVNGNIPNGIITWNATVTTSNTNVPAVGSQYGWYYTPGNALVLTTIPDQIIGTNGSIANIPTSYAPNTSNVFKFGITNNSGETKTINYGYIKLS
jgi:hypothetical protein